MLDDHALFPSALPAVRETSYNAWVTIQIGCDNSCAFCIVPAVRGVEISRPFDEIVAEVGELAADGVTEVTLLGQNVNSYGRDLQLAARRDGDGDVRVRPLFADLLRAVGAVDGIRRVRFTSPHPKDMRPETFAAMAETPAVCPQLHYPLQAGSDRVLAAMHRGYTAERYLARLAEARRVVPDLAVSTDIIVGFPGETDDDFAATLEVAAEAAFDDAFTFIFSPRPGTEAAGMVDALRRPGGRRASASTACASSSSAARSPPTRPASGGSRRCSSRARARRTRSVLAARTPQHRLVHFRSASPLRAGTYATVEITGAAPHHLTGELRDVVADAAAPHAHPRRRALTWRARRSSSSGRRHRASPTSRWPPRWRSPGTEIVAVDAMQVYRGMDIGTAKPTPADRAAVRHHGIDLVEPTVDFTVTEYRAAYDELAPTIAGRARCSSPAPGSTSTAVIDRLDVPGQWPEVRHRAGGRPRRRRAVGAPRRARPGRRRAHRARQPPPRRAGPRGHARQRTAVQLVRSGAAGVPADRLPS